VLVHLLDRMELLIGETAFLEDRLALRISGGPEFPAVRKGDTLSLPDDLPS
jgi:hypothetical protein